MGITHNGDLIDLHVSVCECDNDVNTSCLPNECIQLWEFFKEKKGNCCVKVTSQELPCQKEPGQLALPRGFPQLPTPGQHRLDCRVQ